MNRKWLPYVILAVLGLALFLVKRYQANEREAPRKKETGDRKDPASNVDRNTGFDRRVAYIEYTQHAKCRMQCRRITQGEVEEIMRDGKVNYAKSDLSDRPCPTYALEGITEDDQRVRIVFAQCDLKTKVVTCIDLNTDWECACPGDDSKHKNKR